MKLESKHYKLIGSSVAIAFLLIGMMLTEMNIIGKDGVEISIDAHSRFELILKSDMTVKSAILYNEKGGMVTKKLNLSSRDMEEAIGIIANVMMENNMFSEDNQAILVGVINHEKNLDDNDIANKATKILEDVFLYAFNEDSFGYKISVFSTTVDGNDKRLRQISKEYKVSMAKAKLMQNYHRSFDSANMQELAAMPMQDICVPMFKEKNDTK